MKVRMREAAMNKEKLESETNRHVLKANNEGLTADE